jgi:hypothetical protein
VQLGVKERTVHLWFSDDKIKQLLQDKLEEIDALFVEQMAQAGMVGVTELLKLARIPVSNETLSAEQKLAVIESLLDRVPETATVKDRAGRSGGGGTQIFNMPVAQLSDDQLILRARQLLGAGSTDAIEEGPVGAASGDS